jgi:hypothetical protein
MKRAKKPKPPPSVKPWPIGILAIDCARNSGWSLWCGGRLHSSGEITISDHAGMVYRIKAAAGDTLDSGAFGYLALVLEKPPRFVYGGRGANTLIGLGAARQAWEHAWREYGYPMRRIVRVEPATWRKPVLGKTRRGKNDPPNEIKLLEMRTAEDLSTSVCVGPDEAAAICLGYYATRAGEVGAILPRKILEAA